MQTSHSTIIKCIAEKIPDRLGKVVYPYPDCPVLKTKDSVYVPGMKDKFMLAENYIDKKTGKPIQMTQRMSDYIYFSKNQLKQPPIGWYMSEKFDGQRAIWDGQKFISRGSPQSEPRVYPYVPLWFLALMPPGIALDGEFFIGRGKFTETTGILKTKLKNEIDLNKRWIDIKYQVFDTPSNQPFEDRQELLKNIVHERTKVWDLINLPPYLKKGKCPLILTKQYLIKSEEQLSDYYEQLVSDEAEGVMIRAPKIEYLPKRTRLLLKLKPEEEGECIILGTGHKEGKGQFEGLLGSFHCELIERGKRTGRTFYVGGMKRSIRINYNNKDSSGTIITFKYTEMTPDGIPRFPRYKGIREDFNVER